MTTTKTRVLISGAGIAGPVLAHFLSRTSRFRVTVVEKAPQLLDQGQNIDIEGTALNVLHRMGVLEDVKRWNSTEKGTAFVDDNGKRVASFPLGESAGSPTSEFEILRGDLVRVLYEATKDDKDIEYRFGTVVEHVVENTQDKVSVRLSGQTGQDKPQEEQYDLLVAADGQWSKIRKMVFPESDITVVDKNLYFAYWTVPRTSEDDDFWNWHIALRSRSIGTRPDPHNTTRAYFSLMPSSPSQKAAWQAAARLHDRAAQIQLVKSEFADCKYKTQRLLAEIDNAPDLYLQAIQQIRMARWSQGRVVCLGDAAYAPTPLTGMGTSLAISGAYLLAGHLSRLSNHEHPKRAFEAYETEFKPFVEKIQNIPFFVPAVAHPQTAWGRWLVQSFLAIVAYVNTIPAVVRWAKSGQSKALEKGLVAEIDAPFPRFEAFHK